MNHQGGVKLQNAIAEQIEETGIRLKNTRNVMLRKIITFCITETWYLLHLLKQVFGYFLVVSVVFILSVCGIYFAYSQWVAQLSDLTG